MIHVIIKFFGILVSAVILFLLGLHISDVMELEGSGSINYLAAALYSWYDDPTGFFTSYLIGYAILWRRRYVGSVIILAVSVLVTLINSDNLAWLIFSMPTFLVGALYFFSSHKR